jgi:hypothetical protein
MFYLPHAMTVKQRVSLNFLEKREIKKTTYDLVYPLRAGYYLLDRYIYVTYAVQVSLRCLSSREPRGIEMCPSFYIVL